MSKDSWKQIFLPDLDISGLSESVLQNLVKLVHSLGDGKVDFVAFVQIPKNV